MRGEEGCRTWSWRYSLRSVILVVNLAVLALPVLGLFGLRIFESFLHRQTEAKLISEGAYVGTLYRLALEEVAGQAPSSSPLVRTLPGIQPRQPGELDPHHAALDLLRDPILSSAPAGVAPRRAASPQAQQAGQRIQPLLRAAQTQNLSGVRVLDPWGVVVASTGTELGLELSAREEVRRALQGRYAAVLRERTPGGELGPFGRAGRVRVFVALPILVGRELVGVAYLSRTSLSLFRDVWDMRYTAVPVVLVLLTLIVGLLLAELATRPLKLLVAKAHRIAGGQIETTLEVGRTAPREAHELTQALTAMVATLRGRLEYVREFTRNVSHEFKTPLTGIRGSVELLKEGWVEMSAEERTRFLEIAEAEVHRMERLVRRLLELARVELAEPSAATCDLVRLLGSLVHSHREAGAPVTFHPTETEATVRLAPELAESLFGNLLDNALRHGGGAPVELHLTRAPHLQVRVIDHGPGISAANLPRIFDRFFTTARDQGGTGLGLAIVRAIAQAHDARVDVTSRPGETCFTVEFE